MTTVVAWVGVDQRGPSSLYLASDSRFTWSEGITWDSGCKVFASRTHPAILGYCGDVVFSSISIAQALELIDSNLLYRDDASADEQLDSLSDFLKKAFDTYPTSQQREFTVVYAFRTTILDRPSFFAGAIGWSPRAGWTMETLAMPTESSVIGAFGSGKQAFGDTNRRWKEGDVGRTSRSVFSAFCDHVASSADPKTGGAPQLAGIYIKKPPNATTFGVIHDGRKWLSGVAVPDTNNLDHIEWRDELFQRCDGRTMQPITHAQRHARPFSP